MQQGRQGIPLDCFDTKNKHEINVTCHFEKDKFFTSYIVKTKSKGNKNVVVFSTSHSFYGKTIDNGKGKLQIIKFYDFTKGGTNIVDHLNDYYTTQVKFSRWVMVALLNILDTFWVNWKTIWCMRHKEDILSSHHTASDRILQNL